MRNYKGNMLLLELIIVILFFSLGQLVVVRLFAGAHEKAENSVLLADALLCCEDVAERLRTEDDPDGALLAMGFAGSSGQYVLSREEGFDVSVHLSRRKGPSGELLQAEVAARAKGRELLSLPAARYLAKEGEP